MHKEPFPFITNRRLQTHYPIVPEEPFKALEQDPVTQHMQEERQHRLEEDPYFPFYHYTVSEGYMNDPNGPCLWQGRWHLFYQQFVQGVTLWGHAVSTDLVSWQELPFAICPDSEKGSWSGAVWTDDDRAVAVYYGHGGECGLYCATSSDPLLLNWEPVRSGPVIASVDTPLPEATGPDAFDSVPYTVAPMLYDPFIWRENGIYYVLSAGVHRNVYTGGLRREEYLFASQDLLHWIYLHPFIATEAYSDPGDDGGCPYFVPIGNRHLLLHYSHKYGARYALGHYDTSRHIFHPTSGARINTVSQIGGYCAPAAWRDPQNPQNPLAIYVMHGIRQPAVMSLPHRLTLAGPCGDALAACPAASLEKWRRNHRHLTQNIQAGEVVFPEIHGTSLEMEITIRCNQDCAPELRFFREEAGKAYTSLRLYPAGGSKTKEKGEWHFSDTLVLQCDRSNPSMAAPPPEAIELPYRDGDERKLHIFLDRSVIEVFAQDTLSLGRRVFPDPSHCGVSALSHFGSFTLTIDAWEIPPVLP